MSRPRFLADRDLNGQIATGVLRQELVIEFFGSRDPRVSTRFDDEMLAHAAATG